MPKTWLPTLAATCFAIAAGPVAAHNDRECTNPSTVAIARMPNLADLDLTPATTRDEIVAAWGPPSPGGPAREMETYWLETREPPWRQLWLSFSATEPRQLTRALLLTWGNAGIPEATVLVNRLEVTKTRRRDQLDFTRPLTASDVYAAWGPPDSVAGSGIEQWSYGMADGTIAALVFDGERLLNSGRPGAGDRTRRSVKP